MLSDIIPALSFKAVTPSNTVDIVSGQVARSLYIGTGGDVTVVGSDGTAVLFKSMPTGSYLLGFVKRVNATATTATNIVALF